MYWFLLVHCGQKWAGVLLQTDSPSQIVHSFRQPAFAALVFFVGYFVCTYQEQQGVCVSHTVALQFTIKSILRQKKNYWNSNISSCKNLIFKKSSKRNQNPPSRYYYNSIITNLKFQHKSQVSTQAKISSFKNPLIKIDLFIT